MTIDKTLKMSHFIEALFEDTKSTLNEFEKLITENVYIFGAGAMAGQIYNVLLNKQIDITGFIVDRYYHKAKEYYSKIISILDEMSEEELGKATIIISLQADENTMEEIKKRLNENGAHNILYYWEFCLYIYPPEYLDKNKIIEVANFLEDYESIETYYKCVNGIINSDFLKFSKPCQQIQYFPNDIHMHKGYSRFIDCGSFNGDTILKLKELYDDKMGAIACFEPDSANFTALSLNIKNNFTIDSFLLPCGVSNKLGTVRFMDNCGTGVSGHIDEMGQAMIQTVSIDDVLPNFRPTFIKMDIEGSEIDALMGAQRTIEKYLPDLGICLYHDVKHLYEIPLLIKSFNSNYKIYIRSHGHYFCETVMYATCVI